MIALTGFTNEAFDYLLAKFAPVYDEYSPFVDEDGFVVKKKKDGKTLHHYPSGLLRINASLELYQRFNDGFTAYYWFGYVSAFKYLQFARRIFIKILKKDHLPKLHSLLMTSYRNIKRLHRTYIQLYWMFGEQWMA